MNLLSCSATVGFLLQEFFLEQVWEVKLLCGSMLLCLIAPWDMFLKLRMCTLFLGCTQRMNVEEIHCWHLFAFGFKCGIWIGTGIKYWNSILLHWMNFCVSWVLIFNWGGVFGICILWVVVRHCGCSRCQVARCLCLQVLRTQSNEKEQFCKTQVFSFSSLLLPFSFPERSRMHISILGLPGGSFESMILCRLYLWSSKIVASRRSRHFCSMELWEFCGWLLACTPNVVVLAMLKQFVLEHSALKSAVAQLLGDISCNPAWCFIVNERVFVGVCGMLMHL